MKILKIIVRTLFFGILVSQFPVAAAQGVSKVDVKSDENIRPFKGSFFKYIFEESSPTYFGNKMAGKRNCY
jgi:hypothetical protein